MVIVSRAFIFILKLTRVVCNLLNAVINRLCPAIPSKLPKNSELLNQSAVQLVNQIKSRKVTVTEVIEAYIARIKDVNPIVNAICDTAFDQALIEAESLDELIELAVNSQSISGATNNDDDYPAILTKPLLGIPITIKNTYAVKGLVHDGGMKRYAGCRAFNDCQVIAKLREAGAIVIGITNIPEGVCFWESKNKVHGATLNPYDLSRGVGGSSGGEGAALGAGMSLLGLGSDLFGSIRIPAHCCGIFGHKPTVGVVKTPWDSIRPNYSPNLHDFMTLGPMARYAKDLKVALKAMGEKEQLAKLRLDEPVDLRTIKIYYMDNVDNNFLCNPVSDDVIHAMAKGLSHFETKFNVKVERVNLKKMVWAVPMFLEVIYTNEPQSLISLLWGTHHSRPVIVWELIKSLFNMSDTCTYSLILALCQSKMSPDQVKFIQKMRKSLKEQVHKMLGDDAVLFYPTIDVVAPKNCAAFFEPLGAGWSGVFNMIECTATHVPMGLTSKDKMPTGFSVIASPNCDRLTLAVAEELESEFGGWVEP